MKKFVDLTFPLSVYLSSLSVCVCLSLCECVSLYSFSFFLFWLCICISACITFFRCFTKFVVLFLSLSPSVLIRLSSLSPSVLIRLSSLFLLLLSLTLSLSYYLSFCNRYSLFFSLSTLLFSLCLSRIVITIQSYTLPIITSLLLSQFFFTLSLSALICLKVSWVNKYLHSKWS